VALHAHILEEVVRHAEEPVHLAAVPDPAGDAIDEEQWRRDQAENLGGSVNVGHLTLHSSAGGVFEHFRRVHAFYLSPNALRDKRVIG